MTISDPSGNINKHLNMIEFLDNPTYITAGDSNNTIQSLLNNITKNVAMVA